MIALLDIKNKEISLYSETGLNVISFSEMDALSAYGDKNILYVTNAIEVSVKEIVDMIRGMGFSNEEVESPNSISYIHSTSESPIYISEDIKFRGKFDIKVLDDDMKKSINKVPLFKKLIDANKIEIIGENRKKKLLREFKQSELKREEKQKAIDKELDAMILKQKVSDYSGPDNAGPDLHDAEEIDIMSRGSAVEGGKINTMSELMNLFDGEE